MSNHSEESLLDHIEGLGLGICLLLVGLVVTVGNLGPGYILGVPLLLVGVLAPLVMTHNARAESLRQESRRRPERDANTTYTIVSKNHRRRG